MARQLPLFGPSLNVTSRLKASMREAIRACNLSREEIVDRMKTTAITEGLGGGRGSTITLANLDAWCSETKSNLIPVSLLPMFCHITRDLTPLKVLAGPLDAGIVDSKEMRLLAWAKIEAQSRELARKRKKILSEIEGASNGHE